MPKIIINNYDSNTTLVKVKCQKIRPRVVKNLIQIQHLLKLNKIRYSKSTSIKKNSNTTLVKVKFAFLFCLLWGINSNTTLVKVKFTSKFLFPSTISYSNTTLVKVKFGGVYVLIVEPLRFKYNTC